MAPRGWLDSRILRRIVLLSVLLLLGMQFSMLLSRHTHHYSHQRLPSPTPDPVSMPPPSPAGGPLVSSITQNQTSSSIRSLARAMDRGGLQGFLASITSADDLLFTFGSASLAPFVSNWLSSLARAGVHAVLVGALDEALHAACVAARVPVVRIHQGEESRAGYIRKDYELFKRMGARKVAFLVMLLRAAPSRGVWVCDADVAFLRAPPPSLVHAPPLAAADVLLSTDCLDMRADERGECARAANFNTGVLYLRSTARAQAFVGEGA
jgi:hypothetical protein